MMLYHWITLSSMIILMLFIRMNLRLKTLQVLQNGPIILTFILSLMRVVNFSHEAWWLWFPYSPCSILIVVIFQNPCIWIFSEDLVWFQSMDILHGNRLLFGNSMVVMHTLFIHLTPLCWRVCSPTVTYDWFLVIVRNSWRVPHVGQELLTLPETPDFTPFGEFQNC